MELFGSAINILRGIAGKKTAREGRADRRTVATLLEQVLAQVFGQAGCAAWKVSGASLISVVEDGIDEAVVEDDTVDGG